MPELKILDLKERPEYLPTLAKWHQDEWGYLNPDGTLEQRITKMLNYLNEEFIPTTYVATSEGALLGSAAVVESDMDTRTEGPWLASVYVEPSVRGFGVGSRLVKHIMDRSKRNDIESLYLFTPDQVKFYEQLGWNVLDYTTYRGCKVTVMHVRLGE